jgi:hypothetical protein
MRMKRIRLKAKVGLVTGEEISLSAYMFPSISIINIRSLDDMK